jgi:hypothetical protein
MLKSNMQRRNKHHRLSILSIPKVIERRPRRGDDHPHNFLPLACSMSSFTEGQQIALAVTPKITASLSILGSAWIVVEILTVPEKRANVYNRLLCAMSINDVILSSWYFSSTWPIPEGTDGVYMAIGNERSCVVQGFFLQWFGISPPICKFRRSKWGMQLLNLTAAVLTPSIVIRFFVDNACLAIYYVVVVKYAISEETLRRFVEPPMHLFVLSFGLCTGLTGIFLDLYNNANLWCWIAPYPLDCQDSWTYGESTCERGDNAWIYR